MPERVRWPALALAALAAAAAGARAGAAQDSLPAPVAVARRDTLVLGGMELLLRARALLTAGDPSGLVAYFASAHSDNPEVVAAHLADLRWVFTPADSAEFTRLRNVERAGWLRRYWDRRDALAVREPGERVMEHYRRLDYARAHFRLPAGPRQYDSWDRVRTGATEFDDRGVIYIRHGPPTRQAGYESEGAALMGASGLNMLPNVSWQYARPEGDLVFTFRACATLAPGGRGQALAGKPCPEPRDYRLVESPLDLFNTNPELAIRTGQLRLQPPRLDENLPLPAGFAPRAAAMPSVQYLNLGQEFALLSRSRLSTLYASLLGADEYTAPGLASDVREEGKRLVSTGLATDSYEREYPRGLEARVEVVAAGRVGDAELVHLTWALRGRSLRYAFRSSRYMLPVRLRAAVTDSAGNVAATLDTLTTYRTNGPVPGDESAVGRAVLRLPPGRYDVRVQLENDPLDAPPGGTRTAPLPVTTAPATGFGLSDVVLGTRSVRLVWAAAAEDSAWFNPTGAYVAEEGMELYYEVHGLEAGAEYQTELTITRRAGGVGGLFGKKGPAIRLKFTDRSAGPLTRVTRSVDISRLQAGRYDLQVTVKGAGTSRSESREFEVR